MTGRRRIHRRFLAVALWECLAIATGLGAVVALRRATVAAVSLALVLLLGTALSVGCGLAQARRLLADLSQEPAVEGDADLDDRRRSGTA